MTEVELVDASRTGEISSPWRSEGHALVGAMRPRQWLKNFLVLAAPAIAGVLGKPRSLFEAIGALVAFVAMSASVYLVNDTLDAASDRLHPTKRFRPIAAGDLRASTALVVAAILCAAALTVSALIGLQLLAVLAAYMVVSYAYSLGLKNVPVLELGIVASGFVLRASAGAAACKVAISPWFLIVTSAAAFFIVAGKRGAELNEVGDGAADHRSTLGSYTLAFHLACRIVAVSVATAAYCLWVFQRARQLTVGVRFHNLFFFELSIIPVVLGLLVIELAIETGRGAKPEELALHDRCLQVLALCWLALLALGIYA